jgi:hypothetical protein
MKSQKQRIIEDAGGAVIRDSRGNLYTATKTMVRLTVPQIRK